MHKNNAKKKKIDHILFFRLELRLLAHPDPTILRIRPNQKWTMRIRKNNNYPKYLLHFVMLMYFPLSKMPMWYSDIKIQQKQ